MAPKSREGSLQDVGGFTALPQVLQDLLPYLAMGFTTQFTRAQEPKVRGGHAQCGIHALVQSWNAARDLVAPDEAMLDFQDVYTIKTSAVYDEAVRETLDIQRIAGILTDQMLEDLRHQYNQTSEYFQLQLEKLLEILNVQRGTHYRLAVIQSGNQPFQNKWTPSKGCPVAPIPQDPGAAMAGPDGRPVLWVWNNMGLSQFRPQGPHWEGFGIPDKKDAKVRRAAIDTWGLYDRMNEAVAHGVYIVLEDINGNPPSKFHKGQVHDMISFLEARQGSFRYASEAHGTIEPLDFNSDEWIPVRTTGESIHEGMVPRSRVRKIETAGGITAAARPVLKATRHKANRRTAEGLLKKTLGRKPVISLQIATPGSSKGLGVRGGTGTASTSEKTISAKNIFSAAQHSDVPRSTKLIKKWMDHEDQEILLRHSGVIKSGAVRVRRVSNVAGLVHNDDLEPINNTWNLDATRVLILNDPEDDFKGTIKELKEMCWEAGLDDGEDDSLSLQITLQIHHANQTGKSDSFLMYRLQKQAGKHPAGEIFVAENNVELLNKGRLNLWDINGIPCILLVKNLERLEHPFGIRILRLDYDQDSGAAANKSPTEISAGRSKSQGKQPKPLLSNDSSQSAKTVGKQTETPIINKKSSTEREGQSSPKKTLSLQRNVLKYDEAMTMKHKTAT